MSVGVYDGLRSTALELRLADIGLAPGTVTDVWGGMFEIGFAAGAATFLCLADGTTSMYTSTGGGVIGGHAHESIRVANRSFLAALRAALPSLAPATTFPSPRRGSAAFIAFAADGKRRAEVAEGELVEDGIINTAHPLAAVFGAGHGVVTAVRMAQQPPAKDPWADLSAQTFDGVRDLALRLDPEQLGFRPTTADPHVWGALIDVGLANGRDLTFVALVDGSCAYMVKGGGGAIVRGTARLSVAKESHEVLRAVDAALAILRPATAAPVPPAHGLSVTALTYAGWHRLEDVFDADGKPPSTLAEPFTKAIRLMQTLTTLAKKARPPKS